MKKISIFSLLLFFTSTYSIFGSSYTFSYDASPIIEASDNELGLIKSFQKSSLMNKMSNSLKEEYNVEWIEKYVSESQRYGFSRNYSKVLAKILPISINYYFLEPLEGSVETEITIREEDNTLLSFVYDSENSTLIAINLIKTSQ